MNTIYRKSHVVKTYSLIFLETIGVALSYFIALLLRFEDYTFDNHFDMYVNYGVFLLVMTLLYSIVTDWNRDFFERGFFKEMWAVGKYDIIITVLSTTFLFFTKDAYDFSRLVFVYFAIGNLISAYLLHIGFKEFMFRYYKKSMNSDKLMVITDSAHVDKVVDRIMESKHWNYELTYIAITDKDMVGQEIKGIPVVATLDNVIDLSTQVVLDRVFISLPKTEITVVRDMILEFEAMGILCHYNIEMDELNLDGKEAGSFAGFSVISFSIVNMDFRRLMIKRVFDVIGSLIGIIFTIVLYPFIALAIKIESRGPVIFKQERIGKNGRHFMIYKYRSMYQDAEERLAELKSKNEVEGLMFKMEDDPRITKVGKFLRKTSLDELPQFFNVLKGDMSLVGTRPPTVNEFEHYNAHYKRRLSITPGLTGMWQVNGRSDIKDFDEVVRLDLEYIDNWSLRLDFKLILQTIGVVIFRKGSK